MPAYEPYWRQKSRPCPFHSQGRCLFADSCNFLHIIPPNQHSKILSTGDKLRDEAVGGADDDRHFSYQVEEVAEVRSPSRASNGMNTSSRPVSPEEHSTRMSGLLFALRSIIGPAEEDSSGELDGQQQENLPANEEISSFEDDDEADFEFSIYEPTEELDKSVNEIENQLIIDPPSDTDETREHTGNFLEVYDSSTMDTSGLSFLSDFPTPPFSMPFHPPAQIVTSTPPPLGRPGSWDGAVSKVPESPTPKHKRFSDSGYAESRVLEGRTPSPFNKSTSSSIFDRRSSPAFSPHIRSSSPTYNTSPPVFSRVPSPLVLSVERPNDNQISGEPNKDKQKTQCSFLEHVKESNSNPQHSETVISPSSSTTERPFSNSQLQTPIEPSESFLVPDEEITITAVSDYDNSFSASTLEELCLPLPDIRQDNQVELNLSENAPSLPQSSLVAASKTSPRQNSTVSPTIRQKNVVESASEIAINAVLDAYSTSDITSSIPQINGALENSVTESRRSSLYRSPPISALTARIAKAQQSRLASQRLSLLSASSVESDDNRMSNEMSESEASAIEKTPMPQSRRLYDRSSQASSSSSSLPYRKVSTTRNSTRSPSNHRLSGLERSNSTIPDLRSELSRKVPFGFRRSSSTGRDDSVSKSTADRSSRVKSMRLWIPPSRIDHTRATSALSENDSHNNTPSPDIQTPIWMKPLKLVHAPLSSTSPIRSSSDKGHNHSPQELESTDPNSSISRSSSLSSDNSISTPASSSSSLSDNRLLSPTRSLLIPEHIRNTLFPHSQRLASDFSQLHSAENFLRSESPFGYDLHNDIRSPRKAKRDTRSTLGLLSPLSVSMTHPFGVVLDVDTESDETLRQKLIIPPPRPSALLRPVSPLARPITPTTSSVLLFAIASDNTEEVSRILQSGEGSPNEHIGPQSMLAFTLTNDQLRHRLDIVKVLLAYGADVPPRDDWDTEFRCKRTSPTDLEKTSVSADDGWDFILQYFMSRASTSHICHMSALLRDTLFHNVAQIPFRVVGQDRALEELCRTLKIHTQQPDPSPLVMLCCGPNGHGKSFLARGLGELLNLPAHTVNMTTLQHTHDIWHAPSMNVHDAASHRTLAEFLTENEGNQCIVVLDDIDKSEDERNLWSLLTPWELGQWSDGGRRIDVRNVIWIGTSVIGRDLIFEYHASRPNSDTVMSREEYVELMGLLRPSVSAQLGASLLSRVTAVLPFVPFTSAEKHVITLETLSSHCSKFRPGWAGQDPALEIIRLDEHKRTMRRIASKALSDYIPAEGARSLIRAVSSHLLDVS